MQILRLTSQYLKEDRLSLVDEDRVPSDFGDLPQSDLELLSAALREALDAQVRGVVIGPELDEVALRRAERRARRADSRRVMATQVLGGAA